MTTENASKTPVQSHSSAQAGWDATSEQLERAREETTRLILIDPRVNAMFSCMWNIVQHELEKGVSARGVARELTCFVLCSKDAIAEMPSVIDGP